MGLRKVCTLKAYTSGGKEECALWTGGGLDGLEIRLHDIVINISKQQLLDLFAEELVTNEISKLEQMSTEEVIDYFIK